MTKAPSTTREATLILHLKEELLIRIWNYPPVRWTNSGASRLGCGERVHTGRHGLVLRWRAWEALRPRPDPFLRPLDEVQYATSARLTPGTLRPHSAHTASACRLCYSASTATRGPVVWEVEKAFIPVLAHGEAWGRTQRAAQARSATVVLRTVVLSPTHRPRGRSINTSDAPATHQRRSPALEGRAGTASG